MARQAGDSDEDNRITLRLSRTKVAALVALAAHVVVIFAVQQLPAPKPKPKRIEVTMQSKPPPPPPAMTPQPAPPPPPKTSKPSKDKPTAAPPQTSTVAPELPPSEAPPENRAQLPIVEVSPTPAPPPTGSWKDRLTESLKPAPTPRAPTGPLAPSFRTLDQVALSDAKLFDEQTEKRIAANYGPFLRRGIDALRGNWHPERVLDVADTRRACGHQNRTTFATAVMNKSGRVIDVELKNPSGCPQLDEEAIAAFLRVGEFPHPPAGMFIAPDGTTRETARFPVRFIVTFDGGISLDWR